MPAANLPYALTVNKYVQINHSHAFCSIECRSGI
jgi:hypothetical protein